MATDDDLHAAAAKPRATWRPNPGGATRTLDEALEIARRNGVDVDDELLRWVLVPVLPAGTYAAYGPTLTVSAGAVVSWTQFLSIEGKVVIRVAEGNLASDDQILAVLAHEVHEVLGLHEHFVNNGGQLRAEVLRGLIDPTVGKLHSEAWDVADELVEELQYADRWP